ncbi:MAG: hypothetical protein KY460_10225 [Actinobacteria bacterium]|nr:hypothetical protein [Actinomycetota bacterium]
MSGRRRSVGTEAAADGTADRSTLHDDMAQLMRLVERLHDAAPTRPLDDRELELVGGAVTPTTAEQQLRALGVLLLTLQTYLRGRHAASQHADEPPRPRAPAPTPSSDQARRNGVAGLGPSTAGVAAAAARYIARDLAARRLSEFTSAEGYRLARELARIGGAEHAVEQLLGEANEIRLHPVPLTEALSHRPH